MKNLLLIQAGILLALCSCNIPEEMKIDPNARISVDIDFLELYYLDSNGNDMLNPAHAAFSYPVLTDKKSSYRRTLLPTPTEPSRICAKQGA